jgi:hypothetical protein
LPSRAELHGQPPPSLLLPNQPLVSFPTSPVVGHTLSPEHRPPAPPASMASWPRVTSGRAERYHGCVPAPCYSASALATGVAPAGRPSWPRRRPLLPVPEDEGGHLLSSVSLSPSVWQAGPTGKWVPYVGLSSG